MTSTESQSDSEPRVVSVSKHGQATIPKGFREKLGIDAPGKVLFRETDTGEVVLEHVPSSGEMRGFARKHGDSDADERATAALREKRTTDRQPRESSVEK